MRRTPPKRPRKLSPPSGPVVRVTTPGQLVASLPVQLGYPPSESLVVVCCHEPRGRAGLTLRADLPAPGQEAALVRKVEEVVRGQRASRVVLVVYTDEPDGAVRAREGLVRRLLDVLGDLVVTEALLVRGGRFFSYCCDRQECCPAEGRPVDEASGSAAVEVLKLELMQRGEGLLGSREDLEASIAPPPSLAVPAALQALERASAGYAERVLTAGLDGARREVGEAWRAALAASQDPRWELPAEDAATLGAALHDRMVRDDVVALWHEGDERVLRRLLVAVARRTPAPFDAPVCTTLAWVTYCEGAGSLTTIALERALRTDPDYQMALLLRHALDNALPPDFVRGVTRRTRAALRAEGTGTSSRGQPPPVERGRQGGREVE